MMINPGEFDKRIKLITNTIIDGNVTKKEVTAWAKMASVKRDEFYASYQAGLNPQHMFVIRKSAYLLSEVTDNDGTIRYAAEVQYKGMTFNIIRTYELKDIVELTCG